MISHVSPRHFLDLKDMDPCLLRGLLDRAVALKADLRSGPKTPPGPLYGRSLALIFERNSTRTRVSFEVGISQLGGQALVLLGEDLQVSRGETLPDTARVLSRYVDAILLRTDSHEKLEDLAAHATVPVINGLTSKAHPCQIMADVMTFEEHKGPIRGKTLAWLGDGNNVAYSWITAAARFGFTLRLACPKEFLPDPDIIAWANAHGGDVAIAPTPQDAVMGADGVVTDTWVSMSQEGEEQDRRISLLKPYQVTDSLMKLADREAIFLHCLPAHRGEEVTAEVLDGPQSVVWDEAENRLHAQKAILLWCLAA